MANLVLLTIDEAAPVRCVDLSDARQRACASLHLEGRILVEVTPEGGGQMLTLEFDRQSKDLVSVN